METLTTSPPPNNGHLFRKRTLDYSNTNQFSNEISFGSFGSSPVSKRNRNSGDSFPHYPLQDIGNNENILPSNSSSLNNMKRLRTFDSSNVEVTENNINNNNNNNNFSFNNFNASNKQIESIHKYHELQLNNLKLEYEEKLLHSNEQIQQITKFSKQIVEMNQHLDHDNKILIEDNKI